MKKVSIIVLFLLVSLAIPAFADQHDNSCYGTNVCLTQRDWEIGFWHAAGACPAIEGIEVANARAIAMFGSGLGCQPANSLSDAEIANIMAYACQYHLHGAPPRATHGLDDKEVTDAHEMGRHIYSPNCPSMRVAGGLADAPADWERKVISICVSRNLDGTCNRRVSRTIVTNGRDVIYQGDTTT